MSGGAEAPELREDQVRRYARHIILPEVGGEGQRRLLDSKVLVVGAGGLGSPLLLYLAAAGVGTLGVVDDDRVDLTNLQRQVVHDTDAVGRPKTESAAATLRRVNPDVEVRTHDARIDAANAAGLVAAYDVVADGSDNFATRFLVNDACALAGRPLVSAALLRFEAQVAVWKGHEPGFPCLRCLFPEIPPEGSVPSCAAAGVLGALAGVAGSIQAVEVIKELLGIGDGLAGWLLLLDSLTGEFRKVRVRPDPDCPLCGTSPAIRDLSSHAA